MNNRIHPKTLLIIALSACLPLQPLAADPVVAQSVEKANLRAPEKPLAERVHGADSVFVGKVINRVADGDWVRAELLVEEPLRDVHKGDKFEIIWRAKIGDMPIYDVAEGVRGIAILDDKH